MRESFTDSKVLVGGATSIDTYKGLETGLLTLYIRVLSLIHFLRRKFYYSGRF